MTNKILHALSNRRGPFVTPILGRSETFIPAEFSRDMDELRSLLFLDITHTDYYLKIYLSILAAYPDFEIQFNDTNQTYRISDFEPRGVKIEGATFMASSGTYSYFTDPPQVELPMSLSYAIRFLDAAHCTITDREKCTVQTAAYLLLADNIMRITWPDTVPFTGPLRLTGPWQSGSQVEIELAPSQFPHTALVERIASNAQLQMLLSNFDLVDQYHGNHDPIEKIAMALTVVGLSNPAIL